MAGLSFANDSTKRGLHALPMDWSGGGPGVAIVGLGIEGHSFSKIIADPIFDQWLSRVTLFYLASALTQHEITFCGVIFPSVRCIKLPKNHPRGDADADDVKPPLSEVEQEGVEQRTDGILYNDDKPEPRRQSGTSE